MAQQLVTPQHLWFGTSSSHVYSCCATGHQAGKAAAASVGEQVLDDLLQNKPCPPDGHNGLYSVGGMLVDPEETTTTSTSMDGAKTVTVVKKSRYATEKATVCFTKCS